MSALWQFPAIVSPLITIQLSVLLIDIILPGSELTKIYVRSTTLHRRFYGNRKFWVYTLRCVGATILKLFWCNTQSWSRQKCELANDHVQCNTVFFGFASRHGRRLEEGLGGFVPHTGQRVHNFKLKYRSIVTLRDLLLRLLKKICKLSLCLRRKLKKNTFNRKGARKNIRFL